MLDIPNKKTYSDVFSLCIDWSFSGHLNHTLILATWFAESKSNHPNANLSKYIRDTEPTLQSREADSTLIVAPILASERQSTTTSFYISCRKAMGTNLEI